MSTPAPPVVSDLCTARSMAVRPLPSRASLSVAATRVRTLALSAVTVARRILCASKFSSSSSDSGARTDQPDRPHSRQYTAGRKVLVSREVVVSGVVRSWLCAPAVSQANSAFGQGSTPRSMRVTDRAHWCTSTWTRGRLSAAGASGSRATDSRATKRASARAAICGRVVIASSQLFAPLRRITSSTSS